MKATIGRIVQYRTTPEDQKRMGENPNNTVRAILPAMVVAENEDGTVNLSIVLDGYGNIYAPNVILGDLEGQYAWPTRQTESIDAPLFPEGIDTGLFSEGSVTGNIYGVSNTVPETEALPLGSTFDPAEAPLSPDPQIPSSHKQIVDNPNQRMDYHLNTLPPLSPNPEIPSSIKVIGDNPEQPVAMIQPTGQAEVISSDAAKTETVSPVAAPTEPSAKDQKKAQVQ